MQTFPFQFPSSLLASISKACTIDEAKLIEAHHQNANTSVRKNPFKKTEQFDTYEKVKWANHSFYLSERIEFIKDPLFHAGTYYVQEASSIFLEQAIKQTINLTTDIKVLDLCASPGGKSTLINSLISENSILVSNEVIKNRIGALCENLTKWGQANVIVTNNDAADFLQLENYFDLIVVDAPCSGSGLFRKQADAIDYWSEENVQHCAMRQKRILADSYSSLKPNGILIYSTCSYSTEENEDIVSWLIEEKKVTSIQLQTDATWGITETLTNNGAYAYRFFPHLTKGEGFFIAILRKQDEAIEYPASRNKHHKINLEKITTEELTHLTTFVHVPNNLKIIKSNANYFLINQHIADELSKLSLLHIRKKGTLLGEFKGKDFIPHHELALSNYNKVTLTSLELSIDEALQYLKKSELKLTNTIEKGFCLVKYKNQAIGWVKNIGNRFNNYLPKDWRILKIIDD